MLACVVVGARSFQRFLTDLKCILASFTCSEFTMNRASPYRPAVHPEKWYISELLQVTSNDSSTLWAEATDMFYFWITSFDLDNLNFKSLKLALRIQRQIFTHPNKMAHSHAKANRQRDFISIVIPLGVCSSAHSEDQKECQQYFNPHCLCRGHAGAWDSRTQCPAFLFRCDVFQYCWASDTLWRIERYDIIVFGQCEFAACLNTEGFRHYYITDLLAQRRFINGPQCVQNIQLQFVYVRLGRAMFFDVLWKNVPLSTQKLHYIRSFVCQLVNWVSFSSCLI